MGAFRTILYESGTGFTRQYALLLAGRLGISACDRRKALRRVKRKEPVIYMGWIMAGRIKGLAQIRKRYDIRLVCAVGMGFPHDEITRKLKRDNDLAGIPTFYLQGGCDPKKLGVFKKNMLGLVADSLAHKAEKNAEEAAILEMIKIGASYMNPDYLDEVVEAAERMKG